MSKGVNITVYEGKSTQEAANRAEAAKNIVLEFATDIDEVKEQILSTGVGLPENFPESGERLSATVKDQWTILAPGTYNKVTTGAIEVADNEFAFAQFDGVDFNIVKKIELPDNSSKVEDWTSGTYKKGDLRVGADGLVYRVSVSSTIQEPEEWATEWEVVCGDKRILEDHNFSVILDPSSMEQGSISSSGNLVNHSDRIRTINYIKGYLKGEAVHFTVPIGATVDVNEFDSGVFKKQVTLSSGKYSYFPESGSLKIVYRSLGGGTVPSMMPQFSLLQNVESVIHNLNTLNISNDISETFILGKNTYYRFSPLDVKGGVISIVTGQESGGNNIIPKEFFKVQDEITDFIIKIPANKTLRIFWYSLDFTYLNYELIDNPTGLDIEVKRRPLGSYYKFQAPASVLPNFGDLNTIEYSFTANIEPFYERMGRVVNLDYNYLLPQERVVTVKLDPSKYFIVTGAATMQTHIHTSIRGVRSITIKPPKDSMRVAMQAFNAGVVKLDTGYISDERTFDIMGYDSFRLNFSKIGGGITHEDLEGYIYKVGLTGSSVLNTISSPKYKTAEFNMGVESWAHRGVYQGNIAPENSLDALHFAALAGFEWCETDLKRTADGKIVIFHDAALNRMLRNKTDYSDIPAGVLLADKTLAELKDNYVLVSNNPYQRKPVPTLEEFMTTAMMLGIKPLFEFKEEFTDQELDFIYNTCREISPTGSFGFTDLGSGERLEYMKSKDASITVAYGGGVYLNPNTFPNYAKRPNVFISVGSNWMSANADNWIPKYNVLGIPVMSWGITAFKLHERKAKGLTGVIIGGIPPKKLIGGTVFGVDSFVGDGAEIFKIEDKKIPQDQARSRIHLKENEALTLSDYIDNEVVAYGAYEVFIQFTGMLKITSMGFDEGNDAIDSDKLVNETLYYSRLIVDNNVRFRAIATINTVIHRLAIRMVRY